MLLGALTLLVGIAPEARADDAKADKLKIGTLAPKSSPWGKVFSLWEKAVSEKSGGKLELQFFYNGQQGDEGAMISKMKAGQLDGAAVTAVGLSKVHKDIVALQMPGLFTTWAKLDAARDALKGDFEKGVAKEGFQILGWGDVGLYRTMTKGFALRTPENMKGRKPYMWRDDLIQPTFYQAIGGVTPVPLNIPEVLPGLNTGSIDVLITPSLAAEQFQWASRLDHIGANVGGTAIGAVIMGSKRLDALPADLRTIVNDTGAVAAKALTARIRNEDDAAYNRLKTKMTVVDLSADETAKWTTLFTQVRQRLAQGTFPADLVNKLEGFAK
ncbi:TRAP-type C4-dicarboxylate transport system, periplasmic component [Chondromyces apiculatus DSM 436]|uniref:TRAP-type C4-dicarboxylate transport system, periplasmic component n=1 Tax=Chondromyces apiculatus DSM 436 TaxID=1192034 RepID=A0A017T5A3_9BACT|nr:TRAP-type C4-dicarboxylate transport system, periplasmic component [Chondromyces apiculatus DSM 436]